MSLDDAVTAATKAITDHVKAHSVPIPDSPWGTGVSYAFNPSMEECMRVALEAALPHLPRVMAITQGCVDAEQYATIHNLGFEAAMAQMVAPEGQESVATDWLEAKLDQAAADGIRDAADAYVAEFPMRYLEVAWWRQRADLIHKPTTEQETTNG
jgi:hypothetical protein